MTGNNICPETNSTPRAIGKSKRPDSLGISAGDKLTVSRPSGNSKPLLRIAARTRSRLSRTSASAKPTIPKLGSPRARWVSTRTTGASKPMSERLSKTASDMAFSKQPSMSCLSTLSRPDELKDPARQLLIDLNLTCTCNNRAFGQTKIKRSTINQTDRHFQAWLHEPREHATVAPGSQYEHVHGSIVQPEHRTLRV